MDPAVGHATGLGFIIVAIVIGSLACIVLAAVFGKPRKPRVTIIVVATLFTCIAVLVAGIWLGGNVFSVLMG